MAATGRGLRAAATAGADRAFVRSRRYANLTVDLVDLLTSYHDVDVDVPGMAAITTWRRFTELPLADRIDADHLR